MSRRGLPTVLALGAGALLVPALAVAAPSVVVSAHRAAVSGFAENSLSAFREAAERGETDIEGDTYVTRDGVLVMSHDSPLRAPRCAGPHLGVPLRDLDAEQASAMTCGGEPVPRLDDVIEALQPYPAVVLRVEIKHPAGDSAAVRRDDAVLLARLLAGTGMTARSILQDFDWAATTSAVRAVAPTQRVSALSSTITAAQVESARSAGAWDYSYAAGNATAFWNRYIAARGLRSAVWTVDDPRRARALRAGKAETIITNVPATVRKTLADPKSGCALMSYTRTTAMTSGVTVAAGRAVYPKAPRTSSDGRVVETTRVRITARTSGGSGTLRVAPQGTPYTTTWERAVSVSATPTTTMVEVALGDAGGVRIRNIATAGVTLTATAVGGTVYTCP